MLQLVISISILPKMIQVVLVLTLPSCLEIRHTDWIIRLLSHGDDA
jgi:hypothetical protein